MKICNFYTNNRNSIQNKKISTPNFTSKRFDCYDTTEFFRDDLDWSGFSYFINKFYKDTKKVNIVTYACSTGKEGYSLALTLKTNLKENANKFFPIIGKDIDENSIQKAKRGRYKISNQEALKIDKVGDNNLYRHLEIIDDGLEKYAFMKDSLKSIVHFAKADMCQDIDSIPPKNTILLCRNFWGYLSAGEQVSLADKLSKLLDKTCLVGIGSYDKAYGIEHLLRQRGFHPTEIPNIFRKLT